MLQALPEHFLIQACTHETDFVSEVKEFELLRALEMPGKVSRAQLRTLLIRLSATKKFDRIIISYIEQATGIDLHLTFISCWRLAKVRCKTTLLGKERYANLYRMPEGSPFDHIKHEESLRAIEQELHQSGYLQADIIDAIEYHNDNKTVSVTLFLEPGPTYTIGQVEVSLTESTTISAAGALLSKLRRKAVNELHSLPYSNQLMTQVLSALEEYAMREGFLQVSFDYAFIPCHENSTVNVAIKVAFKEVINIQFIGRYFFSHRQLCERLSLFGGSLSILPVTLLLEELTEYYREFGFWQVNISCQEEDNRLIFCITEGERVKIKNMIISGAHAFDNQKIRAWCSSLLDAPFFEKQKQRQFRTKLIQEYLRAGFWDCVILQESFDTTETPGIYCYNVSINEGNQKKLNTISLEGLKSEEMTPELSSYMHVYEPAIPFDFYLVQEQRRQLLAELHRQGYLKAYIKPLMKENQNGSIDLIWHIEQPYKVVCGKIINAGIARLPYQRLFRELSVEQGKPLTKFALDRSRERLKKLHIFDHVSIKCVDIPDQETLTDEIVRDVVVACVDDDPFEIRARAGIQFIGSNIRLIDLGARYGGSLVWKNPTNHADFIQADFDSSPHLRYGQVAYTMPWLGSLPVRTTVSLYGSRFDEPLFYCFRERLYRLTQDGCVLEFEDDRVSWQWGLGCGVESMKISDIARPLAALIDFKPSFVDRRILYGIIEPCLITRGVDDLINPTKGTLFSCFAKALIPLQGRGTGSGFFKLVAEESFFMPIWRSMVGAFHVRLGHMFIANFNEIMPSERFYLGGAYSLRGYGTDMAPPVNLYKGCADKWCLLPIGGKTIMSIMCELRFPIYQSLGGAIFNDCGVLAQNNIWQHSFVGATGLGLRYATPVGALRFDIAWKWSHWDDGGYPFAWFLTLGQAF